MKRLNVNTSIESFLVMILMIIFTVSISFIILQGHKTFEEVTTNKVEDENARIALSYVNKRIKQNDMKDGIKVVKNVVEGLDALRISHYDYEDGLYTYIFYSDGYMYECYTDEEPVINLSTVIVPVDNLSFESVENKIIMKLNYEYQGNVIPIEQIITLRSTGGNYE